MEVNSLCSWKLKWTLPLLSAVVLSCTQCLTPCLTPPFNSLRKAHRSQQAELAKVKLIIVRAPAYVCVSERYQVSLSLPSYILTSSNFLIPSLKLQPPRRGIFGWF